MNTGWRCSGRCGLQRRSSQSLALWGVWGLLLSGLCSLFGQEERDAQRTARLASLLEKNPEADVDRDGTLTVEEARAFLKEQRDPEGEGRAMSEGRSSRSDAGMPRFDPALIDRLEPGSHEGMPYRLMRPLDQVDGRAYPLILSLHGAGGKGDDNRKSLVSWNGIICGDAFQQRYPSFVLVPQAPRNGVWGEMPNWPEFAGSKEPTPFLPKVLTLLTRVMAEEAVDADRVYVLGASMGGFGSWSAIAAAPDRFAAAIPVCGGMPVEKAKGIEDVPIWAFHGAEDDRVPVKRTRDLFVALKAAGGNMKYTELAGVGHGSAGPAFTYSGDDPEKDWKTQLTSDRCDPETDVWKWLFAQALSKRSETVGER